MKRHNFYRELFCLVAVLACWTAYGATPKLPQGVRVEKDLEYVSGGDTAERLDLYLPEKPAHKPLPLIVWVHGGGWKGGSKAGCPAALMVPKGYAAASVEYRFSQKALFPAQIQDCQAAIRWLRANSKKIQSRLEPHRRLGRFGRRTSGIVAGNGWRQKGVRAHRR